MKFHSVTMAELPESAGMHRQERVVFFASDHANWNPHVRMQGCFGGVAGRLHISLPTSHVRLGVGQTLNGQRPGDLQHCCTLTPRSKMASSMMLVYCCKRRRQKGSSSLRKPYQI
ncbi:hypothetical protein CH063_04318 [Colletotrichum higginsianum]|uniref:Uncharacterized protein n=1 Tax=Colletotrichum higginsianum (strain IMI 349063) TaxID=759273 RepID=H1UUS8_COLHI|nr:hypothetical protein CH63R_03701 [Colletotrichum higginsianum IMI 349063]OBR11405.1 hypothetical protein CH63R_03701 [Colletotrichum higginsianum IMI 349063]CCF31729.1 hypothetical protein CH063_04318 [Colletotrichum higginsianum]